MRKLMRIAIGAKRYSYCPIDVSIRVDGGDTEDHMIKCRRVFKSLHRFLNKYKHHHEKKFLLSKQSGEISDQSRSLNHLIKNEREIAIPSYLRKKFEFTDSKIVAEKSVIHKWILLIKRRFVKANISIYIFVCMDTYVYTYMFIYIHILY
jgi:hypothetical protein